MAFSQQDYIDEVIRQYLAAQEQKQNNGRSMLSGGVSKVNDINSFGNNLDNAGQFLSKNFNNSFVNNLGNKLSGASDFIGSTMQPINNALSSIGLSSAPTAGATTAGTSLAGSGSLGSAISNAAPMATGTGSIAGGTAGASLAGGASTGATAGGAASGAAAGGAGTAAAAMPIGALVALGSMALEGKNRNAAKQQAEAMSSALMQESDQQQEQSKQKLNNIVGNSGINQDIAVNSRIKAYQDFLRENGYADDVVNGVSQGLNSGNKDIADWISSYNNSADGQKNPINIPQTEEEIAAARNGSFNLPVQQANTNANQSIIDKIANGLGDFARGYQENKTTAFAPENMYSNSSKGIMNRIGEGLGTVSRIAENPAVQALVAGGVSTALTGNPLYGAGNAYKFANQKALSNIFSDVLKQNGIDVNPGVFGNISSSDMNALMMPTYKKQENELKKIYYKNLADYHNRLVNARDEANNINKNYKEQKIQIDKQNANSKAISANASQIMANKTGNGSANRTPKPQEHADWNKDLAGFTQFMSNPELVDKMDFARQRFISKYGVDPVKYIK